MPGPIIGRKLIQMGLDFAGKQAAKQGAKKSVQSATKRKLIKEAPKPKPTIRSKAFYDSIYKHL
jgi:hypothetical protein